MLKESVTKTKAFFHSSILNNNHNVLSWRQSSSVLVALYSGFWNRKRNQISKFRFILIASVDLIWALLFAGILCITYFPGVTCRCASCQCKCLVCFFFFLAELKQLIYFAAKNATYAVQKESLKKIQAKFTTITAFISYLYISFSQLVQQDSIQLTVGS